MPVFSVFSFAENPRESVYFHDKIPEERIEPEVERKLVVDKIELPRGEDFKGAITEDELRKFDARFHPLVLVDSKTVQALEFLWYKVVLFNRQVRRKHAEEIRERRARRFFITYWVEVLIASATGSLIGSVVTYLVTNWLKK